MAAYTSETRPHCVQRAMDRSCQLSLLLGRGAITSYQGIDIRLSHWLPGRLAEGHSPYCPFDKGSHQLDRGQVCWKVNRVSRVQLKQVLVEQGL